MEHTVIADFVKEMRRQFGLTQVDLADKSGVGLRFVRDLEQGKQTLRMDKVNQVLSLFGRQVGPVEIDVKQGRINHEEGKGVSARPIGGQVGRR